MKKKQTGHCAKPHLPRERDGWWEEVIKGEVTAKGSKMLLQNNIYYSFKNNMLPHLPSSMRVRAIYRLEFVMETHDPVLPALTLHYVTQLWSAQSL